MLQTATHRLAFVANVLSVRLTCFMHPHRSTPRQTVRRRPGGKLCAGFRAIRASLRTEKQGRCLL